MVLGNHSRQDSLLLLEFRENSKSDMTELKETDRVDCTLKDNTVDVVKL